LAAAAIFTFCADTVVIVASTIANEIIIRFIMFLFL